VQTQLRLEDLVDITLDSTVSPEDRSTLAGRIRHHTIPQTYPTNLLHLANFIGRFESIDRDFAYIQNKLGLYTELPHMRRTTHQTYRQELPARVIERLARFYPDDFEQLHYSLT
jgi:hypothetical protein